MSARRWMFGSIVFLTVAGLIGAACGGRAATESPGKVPGPITTKPDDTSTGVAAPGARPALSSGPSSGSEGSTGDLLGVGGTLPALQPRIVKTASISLSLAKGDFGRQFQEVSLVAARHGGYVSSSDTVEGKLRSGTVLLRVPVDQFELTLGELKGLGKLQSERMTGEDVTGQVVDLQARLRNWEAQESVLLGLMKKATTIDESIKVQRNLQDVQLNIEEIRGALHVLSDQADLSTISVTLAEAGPVPPKPSKPSSLARAWHRAVEGFMSVFAAVVVGLGYLVPLALIGGLLGLVGWGVLRRSRPRASATSSQ